ncbi:hypothetical protein [Paenibacillus xylanexedens]|uniref:hypothetical protein n=1 Tax=Paenibacillus xylanexedens TaxID=528191 RepID=UPI000F537AE3|nr:hypothetical protein [Paenibacillus xylanexedens]RPK28791.1 hypothetical protein EDO6_04318 [Paenibacillus xylanexedens]
MNDIKQKSTKRLTNEEFVSRVYELVGDEFIFLDSYINTSTKLKLRHNKCGREFEMKPSSFLNNGNRCALCSGKLRRTTKEFKKDIFELVGDEYTLNGEYRSRNKKVTLIHNICKNEWNTTPGNFLNGTRCSHCFGTPKKETDQFKREIYELVGSDYTVIGDYKSNRIKIEIVHNKCGHEYSVSPTMFLRGNRCPKCFGSAKWTHDQFSKAVKDQVDDEYKFLEEYVDSGHPLSVTHVQCGRNFKVRPRDFLRGSRCPNCLSDSKGEIEIEKFLIKSNIAHQRQYRISECKDKNPLPFDFAIVGGSKIVLSFIEYDGRQHYEAIDHWGGHRSLLDTQKRDKIKTDYCAANNIPLIRIKYTDFKNIDTILTERLTELGVLSPALVEV